MNLHSSNQQAPSEFVLVITGPTGVGKTAVSREVARRLRSVEVVSCDSMAVYKEMNIGTSKPSSQLREEIPHHLIDLISVEEEFNVARYVELARSVIRDIFQRGNIPLLVGGSSLYLFSLLDGIFEGPGKESRLRQELSKRASSEGLFSLYQELKRVDPESAHKIHPNDLRRILRALEVYYQTGRRISELQKRRKGISSEYELEIYALAMNRKRLYAKIEERVDRMLREGLLEEVSQLWKKGLSQTAYQGHGYKELIGYLEGRYSLDEAVQLTKRNTKRYAKRQISWLRRDRRVNWIERDGFGSEKELAEYIIEDLKAKGKL